MSRWASPRLRSAAALMALILLAIFPAFHYGLFRFPYQYPDADIVFPYWGLLINEGLPTNWYDHPGFFYNILLAKWFSLLDALGLVAISSYLNLPDREGFEPYFVQLIYAARALSVLQVIAFTALVFYGIGTFTRRLGLTILATAIVVASPAVALQLLIIRSELLSAMALFAAFVAFIAAARGPRWLQRGLWLAVAGFAALVTLETKVIAIVPLCGACLIVPFFSERDRNDASLRAQTYPSRDQRWLIRLVGIALFLPFVTELVRLWDGMRVYHFLVLAALVIAIYGSVRCLDRRGAEFADACAWFFLGIGAAYLLNVVYYDPGHLKPVFYVVDHVRQFMTSLPSDSRMADDHIILAFGNALWGRLVLIATAPGYAVVYALAIALAVVQLTERDWRLVVQMSLLIGLDIATAAIFGIRGSDQYSIYYLFWTVIALVIGIDRLLGRPRIPLPVVALGILVLIAVVLGFSVENLTPAWKPVERAQICNQAYIYLHRMRDYFDKYCVAPSAAGDAGSGGF